MPVHRPPTPQELLISSLELIGKAACLCSVLLAPQELLISRLNPHMKKLLSSSALLSLLEGEKVGKKMRDHHPTMSVLHVKGGCTNTFQLMRTALHALKLH